MDSTNSASLMYADYFSLRPLEIGNAFGELNLGAFDLQRITNVLKTERENPVEK